MVTSYKKIVLGAVFLAVLFFALEPSLSFAQSTQSNSYQLLAPLPGVQNTYTPGTFGKYLERMIYLFIVIAALLAFANIVWGGVRYMTGETLGAKDAGKKQIERSVVGILIICASFLLLNTINPYILNLQLDIAASNAPSGTSQISQPTPATVTAGESAGIKGEISQTITAKSTEAVNAEVTKLTNECQADGKHSFKKLDQYMNRDPGTGNITLRVVCLEK